MSAVLQVADLHFAYDTVPVLAGVEFEVRRGALCGLFGPNGCGKTTLFRCCLNQLRYRRGEVLVQGTRTRRLSVAGLARLVAYVPQEHKPPFPYLVREVVLMGRTPHLGGVFGIGREHRRKATRALELVGIAQLAERPYSELSSGQRQMVLIARALAQETPVMLLDEPTSALDFRNQTRIWRLLRTVADRGITVVACSHDPNYVSWYCDEVILMSRGGIVAQGPPSEVMNEPVLEAIYPGTCAVLSVGGVRTVLPREVIPSAPDSDALGVG